MNAIQTKRTINLNSILVPMAKRIISKLWDTEINKETFKEQKTDESKRAYELLTKFVNGLKKKYDKVR